MMKLLWIPIILYVLALMAFIFTSVSGDSDEGVMWKILAGQGYAIPIFFFAFLFIWYFDRRKKRRAEKNN